MTLHPRSTPEPHRERAETRAYGDDQQRQAYAQEQFRWNPLLVQGIGAAGELRGVTGGESLPRKGK